MNGGALVLEHLFQFDVQALAERGMMALTGREQRLRFFGGVRFDPPFLGAGHGEAGVEGFQSRRRLVAWPLSRFFRQFVLRSFFVGDGWHEVVPGGVRIVVQEILYPKTGAYRTNRKRNCGCTSRPEREQGIIHNVVSRELTRS